MQVVLMHDRMDLTPDVMECLKNDILAVLSRYMEIDQKSIRVDLEKGKEYTALVSNVQVKRVYRRAQSAQSA
jgi:cell division topological specificity factor